MRLAMKKNNNEIWRSLSLVSQLGFSVVVPIFMCIWFGTWLKNKYNIDIMLILVILGLVSGLQSAYRLIENVLQKTEEESQELDYTENKKMTSKPKLKSRVFKEKE
jgi:hypothetical protein